MERRELAKYRKLLDAKATQAGFAVRDRDRIALEPTAEECDRIAMAGERDLAVLSLNHYSGILRLIRAAWGRIEDRTYGSCLECGHDIPAARLNALPWAVYCVPCQELQDGEAGTRSQPRFDSIALAA